MNLWGWLLFLFLLLAFVALFVIASWQGYWGLLLLFLLTWGVRWLFRRLFPVLFPPGRLRPFLGTYFSALAGSLLLGWLSPRGPQLGGVYLAGALAGATLFLLAVGIYPFLRILVGRR